MGKHSAEEEASASLLCKHQMSQRNSDLKIRKARSEALIGLSITFTRLDQIGWPGLGVF